MCPLSPHAFCAHTHFTEISDDGHRSTIPCGACRTPIIGKRFECTLCTCFSLHPICKARPPSLSSFLHTRHPLTLVTAAAAPPSRRCDLCFEPIGGAYYTCGKRRCDFDLHPQCSQISPRVNHVLDPRHALELQHGPPRATRCDVCGGDCGGWAYRCGACHVDVHYWCLWKPAAVGAAPPVTSTRQLRHNYEQQPFYFGGSSYNNGYGGGNNAAPYWWPGNYTTSHYNGGAGGGGGSGLGGGSGIGVMNITGSLAVNLLSNLTSNLIQNGFLFS